MSTMIWICKFLVFSIFWSYFLPKIFQFQWTVFRILRFPENEMLTQCFGVNVAIWAIYRWHTIRNVIEFNCLFNGLWCCCCVTSIGRQTCDFIDYCSIAKLQHLPFSSSLLSIVTFATTSLSFSRKIATKSWLSIESIVMFRYKVNATIYYGVNYRIGSISHRFFLFRFWQEANSTTVEHCVKCAEYSERLNWFTAIIWWWQRIVNMLVWSMAMLYGDWPATIWFRTFHRPYTCPKFRFVLSSNGPNNVLF